MPWTDEQVDRAIGALLRFGVILSAGVVLVFGAFYYLRGPALIPDYRVFRAESREFRGVVAIVRAALRGETLAGIQLGLLLLIATPVARVAYSAVAFALRRDWTYVIVTVIVLAILLYGLS